MTTKQSLENALAFLHSAVAHLRAPNLVADPQAQHALECISAAYVAIDAYNKEAIIGEAGPEAIMPLKRSDGKLGVKKDEK